MYIVPFSIMLGLFIYYRNSSVAFKHRFLLHLLCLNMAEPSWIVAQEISNISSLLSVMGTQLESSSDLMNNMKD